MATGRRRDAWDHTASLLTLTHNLGVARGQQRDLADYHPFLERRVTSKDTISARDLIGMLTRPDDTADRRTADRDRGSGAEGGTP